MSAASVLQMRMVPLFFGFFEAIFLPEKYKMFDPRALAFVVSHERM